MTPREFVRCYRRAQQLAEQGNGVLLVPGEIDGEYVVVTWSYQVEPEYRRHVVHPDRRVRATYAALVARNVHAKLEADFGLVTA